jgi:hypothetical protein
MPDAFTWIGLFTRREATSRGCGEGGSGGWLWVCPLRLRAFAFNPQGRARPEFLTADYTDGADGMNF